MKRNNTRIAAGLIVAVAFLVPGCSRISVPVDPAGNGDSPPTIIYTRVPFAEVPQHAEMDSTFYQFSSDNLRHSFSSPGDTLRLLDYVDSLLLTLYADSIRIDSGWLQSGARHCGWFPVIVPAVLVVRIPGVLPEPALYSLQSPDSLVLWWSCTEVFYWRMGLAD